MDKKIMVYSIAVAVIALSLCAGTSFGAAGDIGNVVALRGNAVIERDAKPRDAKLKDGIQMKDLVETRESSRTKMLFLDDSVLTLNEKSKASIKDFVHSKDERGKAIFNLIDGKMRAVVGKTGFEVHTPTVTSAARGTVIDYETGIMDGKLYTTVTCLEGEVEIRSIDPTIAGKIFLGRGMTVTVVAGQPLPPPKPALKTVAGGAEAEAIQAASLPLNQTPPISQQPPAKGVTPLGIQIRFP